ncbi:MAG: THUMP domain-containing protein [Candidatus Poseidoniia archaeon]|nr:THUMP domain-containing protein [Candidatus Poseidoniia archaeon]MDP6534399.1 THUMP domain-containing protein [Candidatus Poseidoniia archaeon]
MSLFLLRYGELGLKAPGTRRRYEQRLAENLLERLTLAGIEARIEKMRGRFFAHIAESSDNAKAPGVESDNTTDNAAGILARTFGIISLSQVDELPTELELLGNAAAEWGATLPQGASFAIRPRRTGSHSFTSQQLGADLGAAVLAQRPDLKVNLSAPEWALHAEVRDKRAFLFRKVLPAVGGLPLHTQGKVLVHAENWRDLIAGWLLAKRGCTLELVEQAQLPKPERAALELWHPRLRKHPKTSLDELPQLAHRRKAHGVVVGWDAQRMVAPPTGITWHAPLLALPAERVTVLREILLEQKPPDGPSGKEPE